MEHKYTQGQLQVLQIMRNSPYGGIEPDETFHAIIGEIVEDERILNIIRGAIPNLDVLLKVSEEGLMSIPNCGKKTTKAIIEIQEKLLKHKLLLPRFRKAMKAHNRLAKYREEHRTVLGYFFELRTNLNALSRHLRYTWKSYNGR